MAVSGLGLAVKKPLFPESSSRSSRTECRSSVLCAAVALTASLGAGLLRASSPAHQPRAACTRDLSVEGVQWLLGGKGRCYQMGDGLLGDENNTSVFSSSRLSLGKIGWNDLII